VSFIVDSLIFIYDKPGVLIIVAIGFLILTIISGLMSMKFKVPRWLIGGLFLSYIGTAALWFFLIICKISS